MFSCGLRVQKDEGVQSETGEAGLGYLACPWQWGAEGRARGGLMWSPAALLHFAPWTVSEGWSITSSQRTIGSRATQEQYPTLMLIDVRASVLRMQSSTFLCTIECDAIGILS
jgi:hypothetical protein